MRMIVLDTEGRLTEKDVGDAAIPLKTLQEVVGGYIELVGINRTEFVIVINEEGKLQGLPPNLLATMLYNCRFDTIVGNVAIVKEGMVHGEPDLVGLEDDEVEWFRQLIFI